jgi:hypothetical protein
MALSILDGNQSATTLSTILSSGQHITAHTVVSLGTQAITDMRSAVSGSVVSVSSLPAISGTVTANTRSYGSAVDPMVYIPNLGIDVTGYGIADFSGYYRYISNDRWGISEGDDIQNYNPILYITRLNSSGQYEFRLWVKPIDESPIACAVGISTSENFPTSGWSLLGGSTISSGSLTFTLQQRELYQVILTNSITVGNSITIGSALPAGTNRIGVVTIGAGTVTLGTSTAQIGSVTASISGTVPVSISSVTIANSITIGSALPTGTNRIGVVTIGAGTVTIGAGTAQIGSVTASISGTPSVTFGLISGTVTANPTGTQTIAGTVTANLDQSNLTNALDYFAINFTEAFPVTNQTPISGTVTIGSLPRPTWTNYSGTVVTANTAVTAISTITRSYLLAQVTTGQMFLNIGATATTLNRVYFSAGQGFAWETSVPQVIVSIISAVTGTNYVLKEGYSAFFPAV